MMKTVSDASNAIASLFHCAGKSSTNTEGLSSSLPDSSAQTRNGPPRYLPTTLSYLYTLGQERRRSVQTDRALKKKLSGFGISFSEDRFTELRKSYKNFKVQFRDCRATLPHYRRNLCVINPDTMIKIDGRGFNANCIAEFTYSSSDAERKVSLNGGMVIDGQAKDRMVAFSKLLLEKNVGLVVDLTELHEHHPYMPEQGKPLVFKAPRKLLSTLSACRPKKELEQYTFKRMKEDEENNSELKKINPESRSCQIQVQKGSEEGPSKEITLLRFPVPDHQPIRPAYFDALVKQIKQTLEQGRSVYVHCKGGNGRTGQLCVAALAMIKLEKFTDKEIDEEGKIIKILEETVAEFRRARRQDAINEAAFMALAYYLEEKRRELQWERLKQWVEKENKAFASSTLERSRSSGFEDDGIAG